LYIACSTLMTISNATEHDNDPLPNRCSNTNEVTIAEQHLRYTYSPSCVWTNSGPESDFYHHQSLLQNALPGLWISRRLQVRRGSAICSVCGVVNAMLLFILILAVLLSCWSGMDWRTLRKVSNGKNGSKIVTVSRYSIDYVRLLKPLFVVKS
jgi:hypothetical protein